MNAAGSRFLDQAPVFPVGVAGEPVNTVQGEDSGRLVDLAFPALVYDLGAAAIDAELGERILDDQRPGP